MNEDLEPILLRAKEDVYTLLQGENFSNILGQGYDFSELRRYESSDDIRHISWINSAKLGEPYIKKMHEERELNVAVSLLIDGRTQINEKQKLMSEVLALLAYSAFYTNNQFEGSYFKGNSFLSFESTKNIESLENFVKEVSKLSPLGLALPYDSIQETLLKSLEKKSLLFVVGDFLDEIELSVLAQKHEVYAILIRDKWEEYPETSADVQLVNPITKSSINQSLSKKELAGYVEKLEAHDKKLFEHFNIHHIKHTKVYNSSEVLFKLEELFNQ
jgi:uncharacterized protein (DUF58 family)